MSISKSVPTVQRPELFFPKGYKKNNPNIIKRIKEDVGRGNKFNYLFTGAVGSGKTYLADIIVRCEAKYRGKWERLDCRNVYKKYLQLLNSNYTDKGEAIQKHEDIVKQGYVVIDDLGDERPSTEASHDYVGCLILERCESIQRINSVSINIRPATIITTNLNMQSIIEMYGSRVVDRLEEHFTIMKFKDHSFRRAKREIIKG